jgi:hypothetical protein
VSGRRRAGAERSPESLDESAEVGHVGGAGRGLLEAAHQPGEVQEDHVLEAGVGVSSQPFGHLCGVADEQVLLEHLERDAGCD